MFYIWHTILVAAFVLGHKLDQKKPANKKIKS